MPRPHAVRRRTTVTRAPRSRARLISATNSRRFVAKPRTPHPIPQAAQLFKIKAGNVTFLLGVQGGYSLSRKRISPLIRAAPGADLPMCGVEGKTPRPFSRGFKGDTLFREREYPPLSVQRQALLSPRHQCRSFLCTCAKKRKRKQKAPAGRGEGFLLCCVCIFRREKITSGGVPLCKY